MNYERWRFLKRKTCNHSAKIANQYFNLFLNHLFNFSQTKRNTIIRIKSDNFPNRHKQTGILELKSCGNVQERKSPWGRTIGGRLRDDGRRADRLEMPAVRRTLSLAATSRCTTTAPCTGPSGRPPNTGRSVRTWARPFLVGTNVGLRCTPVARRGRCRLRNGKRTGDGVFGKCERKYFHPSHPDMTAHAFRLPTFRTVLIVRVDRPVVRDSGADPEIQRWRGAKMIPFLERGHWVRNALKHKFKFWKNFDITNDQCYAQINLSSQISLN